MTASLELALDNVLATVPVREVAYKRTDFLPPLRVLEIDPEHRKAFAEALLKELGIPNYALSEGALADAVMWLMTVEREVQRRQAQAGQAAEQQERYLAISPTLFLLRATVVTVGAALVGVAAGTLTPGLAPVAQSILSAEASLVLNVLANMIQLGAQDPARAAERDYVEEAILMVLADGNYSAKEIASRLYTGGDVVTQRLERLRAKKRIFEAGTVKKGEQIWSIRPRE